jgi:hypothetical protein
MALEVKNEETGLEEKEPLPGGGGLNEELEEDFKAGRETITLISPGYNNEKRYIITFNHLFEISDVFKRMLKVDREGTELMVHGENQIEEYGNKTKATMHMVDFINLYFDYTEEKDESEDDGIRQISNRFDIEKEFKIHESKDANAEYTLSWMNDFARRSDFDDSKEGWCNLLNLATLADYYEISPLLHFVSHIIAGRLHIELGEKDDTIRNNRVKDLIGYRIPEYHKDEGDDAEIEEKKDVDETGGSEDENNDEDEKEDDEDEDENDDEDEDDDEDVGSDDN